VQSNLHHVQKINGHLKFCNVLGSQGRNQKDYSIIRCAACSLVQKSVFLINILALSSG